MTITGACIKTVYISGGLIIIGLLTHSAATAAIAMVGYMLALTLYAAVQYYAHKK